VLRAATLLADFKMHKKMLHLTPARGSVGECHILRRLKRNRSWHVYLNEFRGQLAATKENS
jgi:hypothetical protein